VLCGGEMKVNMIKVAGGTLLPASDLESDKLTKFKTGELYEVNIKLSRNPSFHRKVFAFFNFCFSHWKGGNEFQSERKQFNVFREHLTVLAGYYESYHSISGSVRIEAKSLSYSNMSQEEFEQCYIALTNAAMKHIFKNTDQETYSKLISFF